MGTRLSQVKGDAPIGTGNGSFLGPQLKLGLCAGRDCA